MKPIDKHQVRDDFNDLRAVVHYARAAHKLGLWESEQLLFERYFPDQDSRILEAGCGAGRVSVALWENGYKNLTAFDFAEELILQAQCLIEERKAAIGLFHADATRLSEKLDVGPFYDVVLFMFNGLMQIPGRRNRRAALRQLAKVTREGGTLIFTTHDRDAVSPTEKALWRLEALRWAQGKQDPKLREYGDRYFEDNVGRTFMHLPDRTEILDDLQATGWSHTFDSMRKDLATERRAVRDFSDECRFWVASRKS